MEDETSVNSYQYLGNYSYLTIPVKAECISYTYTLSNHSLNIYNNANQWNKMEVPLFIVILRDIMGSYTDFIAINLYLHLSCLNWFNPVHTPSIYRNTANLLWCNFLGKPMYAGLPIHFDSAIPAGGL